ncbi:MAG: DUF4214 domain-containing protein [Marivita sp.]|uniref:DUF4214 domain-containing protein n=1 Tax=Marivita sp. TaxID=2003365 RepID=UPI001B23D311|nr:DUF4214 domain-containing protein [Marivita sp.]MBO6883323.1 DUF4214 domain-containing protein [Marivita sp.]
MPFLAALGAVSSSLSILSFFGVADREGEDRQEKFDRLSADLDQLKTFATAQSDQLIAQSLGTSMAALDVLERYENEADTARRADLAAEAESLANVGLNEVFQQVESVRGSASLESLVYHLYALPLAMSIRTEVSAVVGEGPLGTPGLHRQIKEAADLIYDEGSTSNVLSAIGFSLQDAISITVTDGSFAASPVLGFVVDSLIAQVSGNSTLGFSASETVGPYTVTRLVFRSHPDRDEFNDEVSIAEIAVFSELMRLSIDAIGFSDLEAFAESLHEHLASSPASVDVHDRRLTTGDDTEDGTSRSDYLFGDDGDDELSGLAGPDAVSGGTGNDILRGGQDADYLTGGPGDDMIFGNADYDDAGEGDTARFAGRARDFEIEGGITYSIVAGADGTRDKLFNVQFLRFDDQTIELSAGSALDGAGDPQGFIVAERVALLYEAALNRNGNIDLPGLNFYIEVTEANNLTDEFLARDLMTSPEFTANFGNARTLSNEEFLRQVYNNVLERDPDIDGFLFYLNLLENNVITKELALADIAISPENTEASGDILMSLYESSDGQWSFV